MFKDKIVAFFTKNPKLWAVLVAAVVTAAAYYGIPPEYTGAFLEAFIEALF